MTSLLAWVGIDSRGPASAYFASDSRITWPGGGVWDYGRKLFACRRYPQIFGYCGDVLFPVQTIGQIIEMIDADLIANQGDSIETWVDRVVSLIGVALKNYPSTAKQAFDLLYCVRDGESLLAKFHFLQLTFKLVGAPVITRIPVPAQSGPVAILGSGTSAIKAQNQRWSTSDVGGTSRAVFSAFCDSLKSGDDLWSGGPPQLVGIWRESSPKTFGMIWNNRRYFYGTEVPKTEKLDNLRWYNELFEICDPFTLTRKESAQPQPRPRGL
ncbi:MAG TPA: hypothetical protein VGK22_16835 [Candidatus Angelobacter sp.]|jgi:hypothetical protein